MLALFLTSALAALQTSPADVCEVEMLRPQFVPDLRDVTVLQYQVRKVVRRPSAWILDLGVVVESADGGVYDGVTGVVEGFPLPTHLLDGEVTFPTIPASGPVASTDVVQVRVPLGGRRTFQRWLSNTGLTFAFSGDEIPQLYDGVHYVDQATDLAWDHETYRLGDGAHVHWFAYETDLLADLVAGDVLLPPPGEYDAYPGAPVYETTLFPVGNCGEWPFTVGEILLGDGTNGGDVGQVGLVYGGNADFENIYASFRYFGGANDGSDGAFDGAPIDSFRDIATEVAQDGRSCPDGLAALDPDEDGVPDECSLAREMLRFAFEPVEGVEVAGNVAFEGWTMGAWAKVRLGQPTEVDLTFEGDLRTAFGLRAEAGATLPRQEQTILLLPLPPVTVPVGPTGIEIATTLTMYVGIEGQVEAQTQVGAGRTDHYVLDVHWSSADGVQVDGAHDVTPWPATSPELHGAVLADVEVFAGATFDVDVGIGGTFTSVGADLTGEAGLALSVDSSRDPWWETRTIGRVDVAAEVSVLGLPVGSASQSLLATDQALSASAPGSPVGEAGAGSRWMRSVDFDPTRSATGARYVRAHPAGGVVVGGWADFDGVVHRVRGDGTPLWTLRVPGVNGSTDTAVLSDGSIVIANDTCTWLGRVDDTGARLWERTLTVTGGYWALAARCVVIPWTRPSDGLEGVIVASAHNFNLAANYPTWTFVDRDGNVVWSRRLDVPGGVLGGTVLADGGLALVGTTEADCSAFTVAQGYWDCPRGALVLKLDAEGVPVWASSASGSALTDIAETSSGRLLAAGQMGMYIYQPRHGLWVAAYEADGTMSWSTTYAQDVVSEGLADNSLATYPGDSGWDGGGSVEIVDDEVYVTGWTNLGDNRGSWLMRLTPDGVPLWHRLYDGPLEDSLLDLAHDGDALVVAGRSEGFGPRMQAWLGRVPYDGSNAVASALAFDQRYVRTEINDAQDDSHILRFYGGDLPFDPTWVALTTTATPTTIGLTTLTPTSVDQTW